MGGCGGVGGNDGGLLDVGLLGTLAHRSGRAWLMNTPVFLLVFIVLSLLIKKQLV